ncbi:MAG: hypothetical protein P1P88_07285, partial [Bacteroidales bacterium]|nr:hypothetical protein [Bacteroidales bacterium]
WFYRKLRKEDFIHLKSENFILKINPLFNLTYSRDREAEQTAFNNTRGIEIKGSIGTKFLFYSAFYENQARFEPYINSEILNSLVAPGQGAVKILENNKFDFSRATGYLSYSPVSNLNIQAGHSKHFIGEGYRSLLLSDNSFNYPFLKISATYGKLKYTVLWNQYQSFNGAYYNYHQRKYGAINYLSWVPKPGYEIALFESVMWPGNTAENNNNFNLNYFNPLLFSRSLIYGLNNEKNILLGINTKIRIYQFAQFFGQLALDNLDRENVSGNNYAFQVGIKHFDLFHEKLKNQTMFFHAEFNFITPYTYSWEDPLQSYTHYNQSLTHPSGTGLKEILVTTKYNFKDLVLVLRGSYLENSIDTMATNFGSNPFLPSELIDGVISNIGNKPGQGIKNELIHFYSELSFCINPATNMKLFLGAHYRKSMNTINKNESMFYTIGIKTDLNNYYYDF